MAKTTDTSKDAQTANQQNVGQGVAPPQSAAPPVSVPPPAQPLTPASVEASKVDQSAIADAGAESVPALPSLSPDVIAQIAETVRASLAEGQINQPGAVEQAISRAIAQAAAPQAMAPRVEAEPEDENLIWVRAVRDDNKLAFYERDARHPIMGEAFVSTKQPTQIFLTELAQEALRTKKIEECDPPSHERHLPVAGPSTVAAEAGQIVTRTNARA